MSATDGLDFETLGTRWCTKIAGCAFAKTRDIRHLIGGTVRFVNS